MSTIKFRKATLSDAALVARQVLEALHFEMYTQPLSPSKQQAWEELTKVCQLSDTLYSVVHATVVLLDDVPMGVMVSYDGANYRRLRANTFSRLSALAHLDVEAMEDETEAGEYYIDSLAIRPEARGKGLGKALLRYAVEQAQQRQLTASLVVDPENAGAWRLYRSLGFVPVGECFLFGQTYCRMRHEAQP